MVEGRIAEQQDRSQRVDDAGQPLDARRGQCDQKDPRNQGNGREQFMGPAPEQWLGQRPDRGRHRVRRTRRSSGRQVLHHETYGTVGLAMGNHPSGVLLAVVSPRHR